LTLERTISRISQDNVLTIAFHIVIGGDSTTLLARPAKRQDAPFEIGILRSASIGQPLHVIRRACRQETPFVPRTLLKEVFPDPGALHACSRRTLHPDARGNGIGRIAATRAPMSVSIEATHYKQWPTRYSHAGSARDASAVRCGGNAKSLCRGSR
jgi:hypothetical protein